MIGIGTVIFIAASVFVHLIMVDAVEFEIVILFLWNELINA